MISRRAMALGAGGLMLAFPTAGQAAIGCQDYPGFRRCTVGVPIRVATARQRCKYWCWAACIEAIFALRGKRVAQESIVDKFYGRTVCLPVTGRQIVAKVNGVWIDERTGRPFRARAEVLWDRSGFQRPDALAQAIRELRAGNPLIIGALGHATLLTAMTIATDGSDSRLEQVIIRDPWPGHPNRRALTAQESRALQFLTKVSVT